MSAKISPETVSVLSSTMLIPLWAKAVEQGRAQPLLRDDEAVRMLDKIDYDFGKFAKAKASQVGCCGRAKLLDDMTRHFIAEHPDAVVVQIGAGLDARYERLGKPRITAWYDLDLPEVIEVRRMLLPESDNHYLGASMFDEAWMNTRVARDRRRVDVFRRDASAGLFQTGCPLPAACPTCLRHHSQNLHRTKQTPRRARQNGQAARVPLGDKRNGRHPTPDIGCGNH